MFYWVNYELLLWYPPINFILNRQKWLLLNSAVWGQVIQHSHNLLMWAGMRKWQIYSSAVWVSTCQHSLLRDQVFHNTMIPTDRVHMSLKMKHALLLWIVKCEHIILKLLHSPFYTTLCCSSVLFGVSQSIQCCMYWSLRAGSGTQTIWQAEQI